MSQLVLQTLTRRLRRIELWSRRHHIYDEVIGTGYVLPEIVYGWADTKHWTVRRSPQP